MDSDQHNFRLHHKIAVTVLGVALFVAVAIGTMGDWMLRSLATDIAQAQPPTNLAVLQNMSGAGGSVIASPVVTADGKQGILLTRMPVDPEPMPATFTVQVDPAEHIVLASQPGTDLLAIGPMRRNLLLTSIAVLAIGTLLGFAAARFFTQPLGQLVSDLDRLAKGDTTVRFNDSSRTDEIGDISRAAVVFRGSITELQALKAAARRNSEPVYSGGGFFSMLGEQFSALGRYLFDGWRALTGRFRYATD